MIIYEKLTFIVKYVFIFFLYSYILFFDYIYINIEKKDLIEIDNEINLSFYEKETNFENSHTKIKAIALYYPEYNNISILKYFNNIETANYSTIYKITKLVKAQITLAKRHKVYGFALSYNLFKMDYVSRETFNIFLNIINFPFLLIWRNEEFEKIDFDLIKIFINSITKFLISDNYIKVKKKPILSINNPYKFMNIKNIILMIRKEAKINIGEIFIFYPYVGDFNKKFFLREFDAIYDFSNMDLVEGIFKNNPYILYYSGIIYKNIIINELNINFTLFRACDANLRKFKAFKLEKFYIAHNIIFKWENSHYEQNGGIIFLNSWNDYKNGNYLEPDEKYGYASINTFSKSILNLPFQTNNFSFYEKSESMIAIHVHVFYEDLLNEIINKINSIPVKYDLFISTISKEKKSFIKKCLLNSNADKYEVKIFENKGRDVFPFIKQMKNNFKKYKYICHIHTKKSVHKLSLGKNWREYIYQNLLGSKEIISEILYDFDQNEKLGFIFPETYYGLIKDILDFDNANLGLHIPNKRYMNFILKKIFRKYKIDEKLVFPVGNMFWAKIKAIYQIFNIRLKFPKELNQSNETIMHAIERIWIYLVKLNGYCYKTIFKNY